MYVARRLLKLFVKMYRADVDLRKKIPINLRFFCFRLFEHSFEPFTIHATYMVFPQNRYFLRLFLRQLQNFNRSCI